MSVKEKKVPPSSIKPKTRKLELVATIILATGAVFIAWSTFQSAKWSGVQTVKYAESNSIRIESNKSFTLAGQQVIVDVTLFTQWLSAIVDDPANGQEAVTEQGEYSPDPESLAGFYYERMRDEFRVALDAWIKLRPVENPGVALTPFDVPEYQNAKLAEAESLEVRSNDLAEEAREANKQSDEYVLLTVLFALALFFAGISSKIDSKVLSRLVLIFSLAILIGGGILLISYPKQINTSLTDLFLN